MQFLGYKQLQKFNTYQLENHPTRQCTVVLPESLPMMQPILKKKSIFAYQLGNELRGLSDSVSIHVSK